MGVVPHPEEVFWGGGFFAFFRWVEVGPCSFERADQGMEGRLVLSVTGA